MDNISKSIMQNNTLVNMPLTVVENASDLIDLNPFTTSYDYINTFDTHKSNDVKVISSLEDESSTLGGFFMSEMDRLTTVKTITGVDLE